MDSELFEKAQAVLTERRMRAVSENERRISEINAKIPQIREINDVLFNTGRELISIISNSNGQDVSDKIDQLKQYNLGAQALSRKCWQSTAIPRIILICTTPARNAAIPAITGIKCAIV